MQHRLLVPWDERARRERLVAAKNAGMGHRNRTREAAGILLVGLSAFFLTSCSIKRTAVNVIGNALAGGVVYTPPMTTLT